jgi:hypothetical protein
MRPGRVPWRGVAQEGFAQLEIALPVLAGKLFCLGRGGPCNRQMVIGVDPHKLSVTIEARDNREILRATGRFGTDTRSYRQLPEIARQWPERIWAGKARTGSAAR